MDKIAIRKSNGKRYRIISEYIGQSNMLHDTFLDSCLIDRNSPLREHNPNVGKEMVTFQAINPKTGKPWQALRDALKSEFEIQ